jgi:hypothetical protein
MTTTKLLNTLLDLNDLGATSITLPVKFKDNLIKLIESEYGQVFCAPLSNNLQKIAFGNFTIIFK